MKKYFKFFLYCFMIFAVNSWTSCSKNEMENSAGSTEVNHLKSGNTQGIIMEAFYWNVTPGGIWWTNLQGLVSSWASVGITAIWLPPSNKCASGDLSCGYDPYDYFDWGDYNQMGTTKTLYGNKAGLTTLISDAHAVGLKVYGDMVLNHNAGGSLQANPNTGTNTYTSFLPVTGLYDRGYNDFHPSTYEKADEGVFSTYPDVCHMNPYDQGWLWVNSNSVAKTYKAMGYDGWRFDYALGYHPWVVEDWLNTVGGFGVGEYWVDNVNSIQDWIDSTGSTSSAFDFPCLYALQTAFMDGNLAALSTSGMLCKSNPSHAVTFVTNHDEDYITTNKLLAYAFIMTHEGTPCIFYTDYESELSQAKLNNLIWINKNLAGGTTTVLYASSTQYIAKMSGSPGLVIYINTSSSSVSQTVTTNWKSETIKDYTGNVTTTASTSSTGSATITAPADSYSVWSTE